MFHRVSPRRVGAAATAVLVSLLPRAAVHIPPFALPALGMVAIASVGAVVIRRKK